MLDDAGDAEDDYVEDIAGGTAGFYDDVTGRLVVRGDRFGAYEEMVLVHELTHALQDQWFQLDRPELEDGGEAGGAFGALIEGDVMRVMLAWEEAQPPDVRDELAPDVEDDELDGADEGFDPYLAEGEYLYGAGLELVLELLERGGQELLDETFRNPPGSSQQVLHPELVGEPVPKRPTSPSPSGKVLDEGVLGEVGLAHLLETDPQEPGPQEGWQGDSYVTYRTKRSLCTVANVETSDAGARDRLLAALQAQDLDADPSGPAGLALRSCRD